MTFLHIVLAALALQGAGWTWTLYEGDGPLVLANEVPDMPELRATLECEAGTGVAKVSVYGEAMAAGFASITAGDATATAQAEPGRDGKTSVALRADHPVFTQFVADGFLKVAVGEQSRAIEISVPHMAKLRRFAERCGG